MITGQGHCTYHTEEAGFVMLDDATFPGLPARVRAGARLPKQIPASRAGFPPGEGPSSLFLFPGFSLVNSDAGVSGSELETAAL